MHAARLGKNRSDYEKCDGIVTARGSIRLMERVTGICLERTRLKPDVGRARKRNAPVEAFPNDVCDAFSRLRTGGPVQCQEVL